MPHLDLIQEKATKVQYKLSMISAATCIVEPEFRNALYSGLAERIVFSWHMFGTQI